MHSPYAQSSLSVRHAVAVVTQRGRAASPSDNAARHRHLEVGFDGRGLRSNWRWLLSAAVSAATAARLAGVHLGTGLGRAAGAAHGGRGGVHRDRHRVPLWQQAHASQARADAVAAARAARAAMRVAMQDALDPFVALLLQLATARPRQKPLLWGKRSSWP
jgi:hypothetical protein